MSLVRLSDTQLDAIFRLAQPLPLACRDEFLRLLALEFRDRTEVGDGELHRLMCTIIEKYHLFTAPSIFETSRRGRRRSAG